MKHITKLLSFSAAMALSPLSSFATRFLEVRVVDKEYFQPYRYSVRGYYYMRLGEPIDTPRVTMRGKMALLGYLYGIRKGL